MEADQVPEYKVLLVGCGNTGKSSIVNLLTKGEPLKKYSPTKYVSISDLPLETNKGRVNLKLWDTAGRLENIGMGEGYYINSKAVLFVFSLNDRKSFTTIKNFYQSVKKVCNRLPCILVGTNNDKFKSNPREVFNYSYTNYGDFVTTDNTVASVRRVLLKLLRISTGTYDMKIHWKYNKNNIYTLPKPMLLSSDRLIRSKTYKTYDERQSPNNLISPLCERSPYILRNLNNFHKEQESNKVFSTSEINMLVKKLTTLSLIRTTLYK